MKYVLDASVALKWVLPEAGSDKAMSLGQEFQTGSHDRIAPDSMPIEIAHALTRTNGGDSFNRPTGYSGFEPFA